MVFLSYFSAIILIYNATILWFPKKRKNIQLFMTSEGNEGNDISNIDGVIFLFGCFYLILYIAIIVPKYLFK